MVFSWSVVRIISAEILARCDFLQNKILEEYDFLHNKILAEYDFLQNKIFNWDYCCIFAVLK